MNKSEYSPYKVVHHIDRLNSIKTEGRCVPITIHLAPTTYCNCSCYYCYVKDYNTHKCQLEKEALFSFLEAAADKGVKAVEITGGGEPTVYPHFDETVIKCHELGLDVGLVTNGYHLNPNVLKYATWIRVSIDTFDKEKYRKIRNANLPDLSCIKELSEYGVVVGASCVITESNYDDVFEFVCCAKKLGFDNVWLKGVEDSDELFAYKKEVLKRVKKAESLSDDGFRVFVGDLFRDTTEQKKEFRRCSFQHVAMMVYSNGDVYPCCSLQGRAGYAYANIYKDSFEHIVGMNRELPVERCPLNCFWSNKNKFMEYIMLDEPRHVNFM